MEGQQVLHSLWKALAAELLQKGNGIPAGILRVPKPLAAVLDPQAVHFRCGMVSADPPHLIAQMGQQLRQIRFLGDLHFCVCEAISDLACHDVSLLSDETQKATQGIREIRMPWVAFP